MPRLEALLDDWRRGPGGVPFAEPATRLFELSELQAASDSAEERRASGEQVCPRALPLPEAARAVHAHFGPGPVPFAPGFRVDRRWGGRVRLLGTAGAGAGP